MVDFNSSLHFSILTWFLTQPKIYSIVQSSILCLNYIFSFHSQLYRHQRGSIIYLLQNFFNDKHFIFCHIIVHIGLKMRFHFYQFFILIESSHSTWCSFKLSATTRKIVFEVCCIHPIIHFLLFSYFLIITILFVANYWINCQKKKKLFETIINDPASLSTP